MSGRDVEEARQNSAYFLTAAPDRQEPVTVDVDRTARRVRTTLKGVTRTATFCGDQGCVTHPEGQNRVFFTPLPVRTTLPDAALVVVHKGQIVGERYMPGMTRDTQLESWARVR